MLKGWVSSKLSNNEIYGWFLNTEDKLHRKAIISVHGVKFDTYCNTIRGKSTKYPLYKDFGFRLLLTDDFLRQLPNSFKVQLIDKETSAVIYTTGIKKISDDENVIVGKLSDYFQDLTISGYLYSHLDNKKRIAVIEINNIKYECVANQISHELCKKKINDGYHRFKLSLSYDEVKQLPNVFEVKLYDKKLGTLVDTRKYTKKLYLIPNNFNEYLNYSTINPVVYAPYTENHKRCFAFMENIASSLEKVPCNSLCSIIMPTYNRKNTAIDAIQSVLAQTYSNFELIVVDDKSDDDTIKTISSFLKDKRVKVIQNEKHCGVSHSRNIGIEHSKGDYIFYLDSDNTWDPRYLKVMLGAFKSINDARAIYCGQYLFRGKVQNSYAVRFASFNKSLLENRNYIDINCFAHSREVLNKIDKFNTNLKRLVDYDFIIRINAVYPIYSIPVLLSNYYLGKDINSISLVEDTPEIKIPKTDCYSKIHELNRPVSAIIPNYENIEQLKDCIKSLVNNKISEIVVIDNHSSLATVKELKRLADEGKIKLIDNKHNFGFSYAINQGLKVVNSKNDVLLVNNDVELDTNSLPIMSAYAYSHDNVGIIVPRQIIKAHNKSITSHVPFADLSKECDVTLSQHFMNIDKVPLYSNGQEIELNYAPFFCVFIKQEVLKKVGKLDAEHGRHYRSDRIFCDYIRNVLGLKIYYAPDAIVYHKHSSSTKLLKRNNGNLYQKIFVNNTWDENERFHLNYKEKNWEIIPNDHTELISMILNSGYFDENYYVNNYARNEDWSQKSPLEHYLNDGWKRNFNPSEEFDSAWYLERYKDVEKTGMCPLVHYLKYGIKEGRCIGKDYEIQKQNNESVKKANISSSSTNDILKVNSELISKSGLFDIEWYRKEYLSSSDSNININPIEHYLLHGWKNGYNPSNKFNTSWYLNKYQDVKNNGICPLIHYIRSGLKEGRKPTSDSADKANISELQKKNPFASDIELIAKSDLFDETWYRSKYMYDLPQQTNAIEHYLSCGWHKGYNPSAKFSTSLYLDLYPDVLKSKLCPLVHYLKSGTKESRRILPVFTETPLTLRDKLFSKRNNKNPLISIVVASYNYEGPIRQTLDSIVTQTYKNYEVIVVDDGSKDNSVKVINEYVNKYKNIYLYTHDNGKNCGLPKTVKLGIDKARGDYVAFCEADDYWHKDYLLEKVNLIHKYADANVIINDVQLFGEEEKVKRVNSTVVSLKAVFKQTKTYISPEEFRKQNWILTFSCVMLSKKILKKCDFLNVTRNANLDWWLWRQVCLDNNIFFVDKKLTFWRMHDSYMEMDNVMGRLQQEKFLTAGDRLLLKNNKSKAKELLKYTNTDIDIVNGKIEKNEVVLEKQPTFSIIMPTYNRAYCIKTAIDSILNQTYKNFELIIVDDGSSDDTESLIANSYPNELNNGKIVYLKKSNEGVCKARNYGLAKTNNEWIVYVDSDNICSDIFLETFAVSIVNNPSSKAFYARLVCWESNKKHGEEFNLNKLLKENYIDLGVYCHHSSIYHDLGGFDENMTRLVDWELITRYSKKYEPVYVNKVILLYNDKSDSTRITVKSDLYDNYCYFRKKHCNYPIITTVITTYNHKDYIGEAIESAIIQMGEFQHEILISDDNSNDGTRDIIDSYAKKYPNLIRDISSSKNLGISLNMKKCFAEAKGEYVAVLEGDDYWIDRYKLQRQLKFLQNNDDCSMVFSRIKILNKGKFSLLDRHNNLPSKLSGDNVIKEPTLNYIANFSCCLFRSKIMKNLPEILYENRFNEIALSFYIVNKGFIGYIPQIMSVYRLHDNGVWSASGTLHKLKSGLTCRQTALAVCDKKYAEKLKEIIQKNYIEKINSLENRT